MLEIICITLAVAAALFILYTAALRGRRGHPKLSLLKKYRFAHRGWHDKPSIPENSIPAFRRAAERGWGAELDVHLTKDGALAVIHDSSLERTAGANVIVEELTAQELEQYRLEGTDEHIPLFDEVLEIFERATPLIIELKTRGGNHKKLAKAVCDRLDSYGGDFCIESFDPFALRAVKKLRPDFCRGQLSMNFLKTRSGLSAVASLFITDLLLNGITRPDFVAYRYEDRDNAALRWCLRFWRVQEFSWTIRTKADMLEAERLGSIPIFEQFDPEA